MPLDRASFALVPHPDGPAPAWRIDVDVRRASCGTLRLVYRLAGDLSGVRVPPTGAVRRGDRLWERTCFEAFVASDDGPAYVELNFAPSGEWAAYAFDAYRASAAAPADAILSRLVVRAGADALEVAAAAALPAWRDPPLRVGLSAVIETDGGVRSYWALRHPPGPPDFHHATAFAARLGAPGAANEERRA